jgi:hypothetical protein
MSKEEVYALYMPTMEVSICWMRVLGCKNDRVVIHRSHAEYILKATKMSLKRVYYIEHMLALCCASTGYWWGACLPIWLVLISKKGKVNKRAMVLYLNPAYTGASGAFPASMCKRAIRDI